MSFLAALPDLLDVYVVLSSVEGLENVNLFSLRESVLDGKIDN